MSKMNTIKTELLNRLKRNQREGSKPRCHMLTHGPAEQIAERLNKLIEPFGLINSHDQWMPQGFDNIKEAQLGTAENLITNVELRKTLLDWWLAVSSDNANTPNWDIASTCTVDNRLGLLLIEAKAHDTELIDAEAGKSLVGSVSAASRRNHVRIGACIEDASIALAAETNLPWALSRDWNYQMSNRFAWAWKLTTLGIPVILVYLGFLEAEEMRSEVRTPFNSPNDWDRLVKEHSKTLFPASVWNQRLKVSGQSFVPLIRSLVLPL